ncbi:MAG: exodeoxyribonuclease VII large subunit [Saprospiraceae bacterium]
MQSSYSLFELNEYIRRVFALNFQDAVWIRCEIAQINASRGHHYLNLIEKSAEGATIIAQSSAVLWASKHRQLRRQYKKLLSELLQNGVAVLLQVKIDYDERYGLKLLIEDIDPSYTMGQMELKRQQILETLQQENLLAINSQIPLPTVIQRVAIISSETAAGLQDYLNQVATNSYGYQLSNQLFPAAMQGANVEKEVLRQLKKIAFLKDNYDAVIMIRGGGSKLDLAGFDNLALGRAVANFPLPVLVGIGHEIDETILDRVAHTSLKTPTAVADFLINRLLHFESTILEYKNYIFNAANYQIQAEKNQLGYAQKMIQLQGNTQLKEAKVALNQFAQRLPLAAKNSLALAKNALTQLAKITELLAPETALKRGFSITTANGKVVTQKSQVKKGTVLTTQLLNDQIKSTVNE